MKKQISEKQLAANRRNAQLNKHEGRPKGSISKSRAIANIIKEITAQKVQDELEPILEALVAKAKSGDVPAIKELFDRGIGKATSPAEDNMANAALISELLKLETALQNIANGSGGEPKPRKKLLQKRSGKSVDTD